MNTKSVIKPIEIGSIFNNHIVIERVQNNKKGNACYKVKCILCGNEKIKTGNDLRRSHGLSCPICKMVRLSIKNLNKKADASTKRELKESNKFTKKRQPLLYYTWQSMKARCYRKTHPKYSLYGERGIYVCEEWRYSFKSFCEWSLSHGYKPNQGLSIDRIDNDDGYKPDNCRWTDVVTQNNNRRPKSSHLAY